MAKFKIPAKIKRLSIPQYASCQGKGYKIYIAVTPNPSDFVDERFVKWNITGDGAGAVHVYSGGFESWIVLPEDASISTIVHECWHCVHRIFKQIKADGLDNETVAYTLGWLTEQATDFLYSTPEYQKRAKEFLKKKVDTKKKKR